MFVNKDKTYEFVADEWQKAQKEWMDLSLHLAGKVQNLYTSIFRSTRVS